MESLDIVYRCLQWLSATNSNHKNPTILLLNDSIPAEKQANRANRKATKKGPAPEDFSNHGQFDATWCPQAWDVWNELLLPCLVATSFGLCRTRVDGPWAS